MTAEKNPPEDTPENLLEKLLERARAEYIEANGEEPPKEVMQDARTLILRRLASESREKHRDVYDALAKE